MKRFPIILLFLLALNASAVDVRVDLKTMVRGNVQNRPVSITNALSVTTNGIIPANIYRTNSGSSGVFYMSNMIGGITYTLEVEMPLVKSSVRFTPPETNVLVAAADYTSATTNDASGSVAYTQGAANNRFIEDPLTQTNGQFLTWNGSAWVPTNGVASSGSGDVTTAQLLTTSNGLRTISYSIGDALTNLSATASNYLWGLINAHDSQITTINIDLSDLSDGINTLGVSLNTVSDFANSSTVALSNNVSGLRSSFVTISNHYVLTSNAVHQLSNTVANLSPGSGTAGQYVTNLNGTVSNSFRIVSTDGNGFVNGFYQNGNTLQITNGTQGVVASYDEDAQVWDFAGTISGDNLTLSGSFSTDQLNVGTMVLTNALSVTNGGTGRTNITSGSLLAGNGTSPLDEVTLGSGLSLSGSAGSTRTLSATASGSGGGRGSSNVVVSSTNEVYLSWSESSEFRVYLLTNANITFTNINGISNLHGYVFFQQDTNGSRTVRLRNAHGLIQTNESLAVSTSANALDLLEVKQSFFPTNLLAWWPKDFQPRVAFTNSLASGGGGGEEPGNTNGLVAWWKFDEGSGTTAEDSAGSNDGTLNNSPTWSAGHSGNALNFTKSASMYVNAGNHSSLNLGEDFTIAAWVKMTNMTTDTYWIVGKDTDTGRSYNFGVLTTGGTPKLCYQADGLNTFGSASLSSFSGDGNWHHLAMTLDSGAIKFYIDGVLDDSGAASAPPTTATALYIGGRAYPSFGDYWNGSLDEVKIWNRTLTDEEVADDAGL